MVISNAMFFCAKIMDFHVTSPFEKQDISRGKPL